MLFNCKRPNVWANLEWIKPPGTFQKYPWVIRYYFEPVFLECLVGPPGIPYYIVPHTLPQALHSNCLLWYTVYQTTGILPALDPLPSQVDISAPLSQHTHTPLPTQHFSPSHWLISFHSWKLMWRPWVVSQSTQHPAHLPPPPPPRLLSSQN